MSGGKESDKVVAQMPEFPVGDFEQAAKMGCWKLDVSTGTVQWSAGLYRILNRDAGQPAPDFEDHAQFFTPESWQQLLQAVQLCQQSGMPYEQELCLIQDGEPSGWLLIRGDSIRNAAGQIVELNGVAIDLTERKNEELRIVELFETSPVAHVLVNDEGYITLLNRETETLFGYTRAELLHQKVEVLVPDELQQSHVVLRNGGEQKVVSRQMASGRQVFGCRKDGGRVRLNIGLTTVTMGGKSETLASIVDITRKVEMEEQQALLQRQLFEDQKQVSLGRLAGGVAHDINNILTVVIGNVEMLKFEREDDSDLINRLDLIDNAATKSADMIKMLLGYARSQAAIPIDFEINGRLRDMKKVLENAVADNLTISFVPATEDLIVNIDPTQLEQIVVSLCINSSDAINGSGTISIVVDKSQLPSELSPEGNSDEFVRLRVVDNGCGMDEHTLARVFDPFFSTKQSRGTGLGLATVYGIVMQNHGYISCDSALGIGTTMTVYLPVVERMSYSPQAQAEPASINPRKLAEVRVLAVDDDESTLQVLTSMLEQLGCKVSAFTSPDELVDQDDDFFKAFDLMVSDVVMPSVSGPDLARLAKSKNHRLKVVFLSGYSADELEGGSVAGLEFVFLQKPYTLSRLKNKIAGLLSHS